MTRWTLAALALMGCDPDDVNPGGQIGSEVGAECRGVDATDLGLDDVSALGFAPRAILDIAGGSHTYTMRYDQVGTETELTLTVTHDGGAMEWVDYEIVVTGDGSGPEIALDCLDQLEIEVDLGVATDDGAFAETLATRVTAVVEDQATLSVNLEQLAGSFDPWDHAPADNDYDEMRAWLSATFGAASSTGEISGQGSGEDGEVAFAENLSIATWRSDGEADQ